MTSCHWRRPQRCIKVRLGHRAGLQEWYPSTIRCRVMIGIDRRRPVWRISWVHLGQKSINMHHPQRGVSVFPVWEWWPRGLWLWEPICRIWFEILLMAPCVTRVIRAISNCRCTSQWVVIFQMKCAVALSEFRSMQTKTSILPTGFE